MTTAALRNSALLDVCGILIPDGTINSADRGTMIGFYGGIAAAVGATAGTYCRTVGTPTDTDTAATVTTTTTTTTVNCG